jgi:hypothetical protein
VKSYIDFHDKRDICYAYHDAASNQAPPRQDEDFE